MATTLQILRSYANTSPEILNDGELAYSFVANALYIGDNANNIILIGGSKLLENVSAQTAYVSYQTLNADGGEF